MVLEASIRRMCSASKFVWITHQSHVARRQQEILGVPPAYMTPHSPVTRRELAEGPMCLAATLEACETPNGELLVPPSDVEAVCRCLWCRGPKLSCYRAHIDFYTVSRPRREAFWSAPGSSRGDIDLTAGACPSLHGPGWRALPRQGCAAGATATAVVALPASAALRRAPQAGAGSSLGSAEIELHDCANAHRHEAIDRRLGTVPRGLFVGMPGKAE